MATDTWMIPALAVTAGAGVGYGWYQWKARALRRAQEARQRELELDRLKAQEAARLEMARAEEAWSREKETHQARLEETERRLAEREAAVNRQLDRLAAQEDSLRQRAQQVDADRQRVEAGQAEALELIARRRARLEEAAHLSAADARAHLLREVEQEVSRDAADLARHLLDRARQSAEEEARRIVALAIQRFAGRHTMETTTATVTLTGDDMKGRIIGRDGRNIRAFEQMTGVTVLVDETPSAVVLSGFDPVRREIARLAMEHLIVDGRIHPARIEEEVQAATQEIDAFVQRQGEEAVFRAGQPPMHDEVVRTLGRLHFRHSFSQNVLHHSLEVSHLCGMMAAELGLDATLARRAGLLHDIGKAVTHEVEGPHALVGADLLKRCGEDPAIVNAVASHHDEVPHENLYGILVAAADAISASRPGSRSETMTTYLKRLENLEQIALGFPGVERAFAVQAGRELRVIVRPEAVDDAESLQLARKMARRVEEELLYPGQIRITVIRETRCVEYAK